MRQVLTFIICTALFCRLLWLMPPTLTRFDYACLSALEGSALIDLIFWIRASFFNRF